MEDKNKPSITDYE